MKSLEAILQQKKSFEPSSEVKGYLLNSVKNSFDFKIGVGDYKTPGFLSYDPQKYNHYQMLVGLLYALELFAAVSIVLTTSELVYIIIKLVLVIILIYLDIIVAKNSRAKERDNNSNLFRWTF